jgi:putative ABC transport system permease protein
MELANIIASLRRNKLGALLIVLQIALTMAIVSNAIHVIALRNAQLREPSGLDEPNIFFISDVLPGAGVDPGPDEKRVATLLERDLEVLRGTPDVIDAYGTDGLPLMGRYEASNVSRTPSTDMVSPQQGMAYHVDDHALQTLGLRLVAGRWFHPSEVVKSFGRMRSIPQIVVTRALAEELFPNGGALGSVVYINGGANLPLESPVTTIIGIVDALRIPGANPPGIVAADSFMYGWQRTAPSMIYVVRTRPGRLADVMRDAEKRLRAANPLRVISRIEPFAQTRREALRLPRSTAIILVAVCGLLLTVTAFGIIGLTSYWIGQRRHHIGMRRALGARRGHILAYYLTENLLLAGLGSMVGIALALGVNLWLMRTFAVQRLDAWYVIVGAIAVLALGQLAAFWPAFRAVSIPPALAARAR